MARQTLKMFYPISIKNIRRLKAGDLIEYSGQVLLADEKTIDKYRMYERLEGTPFLNLSRELILFCLPVEGTLYSEPMKIEPDELEYLFMSGITATIGLNVEEEEITAIYRRFSRVNLSLCDRTALYPLDVSESVPEEVECGMSISLKDVLLYVDVSSQGTKFGSDADAGL
ncbi:hypothetical protein V511_03090 [Mesotoga sp. Brook.08.YT.4.2.5.1]|uniref:hypothetical protein n=1 Tax=unclassified Mesotoga TaxID=1184398 RepID=UPI000C17EBEC|nr:MULTISPECIES: hypothetical protein [unclassified Mesotoga]RAM59826.1 hypothetical protein DS67_07385 [Mesotoga sp. SC_4PWA21]PNE23339.1 hypothetical protein V511_03090 [Mesotoga sp. Brook.08.YT.4.2.5.1]PNS37989.1 hypothetical protein RJ60_10990 [Mesotoga sp. B105.6.4]PVD17455.1 hypothetical protein V512_011120 [Mesotoga sp. Brook.08.105.5.1]RAO97467.1 hypothetical protein M388_01455 [Mesotoga sp. Brook.08.YT.4.2.5.4.]